MGSSLLPPLNVLKHDNAVFEGKNDLAKTHRCMKRFVNLHVASSDNTKNAAAIVF